MPLMDAPLSKEIPEIARALHGKENKQHLWAHGLEQIMSPGCLKIGDYHKKLESFGPADISCF